MSADVQSPTPDNTPKNDSYFERIPLWTDACDKKCFEVMADEFSGRIPVTRLESWRGFANLLESGFFNRPNTQLVFRGHRRYEWGLMPTLGRLTTNGIVTERLAKDQLDRFKKAVRGRLSFAKMVDDDDELWSIGQHHGLMTPLLDWTYSPYVALFFAFHKEDSKEEADNPYRTVYVLNKSFLAENQEETGIRLWEPRHDDHGRLVNQAGLFTFSPTDATIENKLTNILSNGELFDDAELLEASEDEQPDILARYICKIYIRNEERDACLRHLRRMNVHHASLFPDLLGASDYCNILTAEVELASRINSQSEHANDSNMIILSEEVESPEIDLVPLMTDPIMRSSIEMLLHQHLGIESLESEKIGLMAEEITSSILKNNIVDWEASDVMQARLRNTVRVVLRKYGYPRKSRERVAEQIIGLSNFRESGAFK